MPRSIAPTLATTAATGLNDHSGAPRHMYQQSRADSAMRPAAPMATQGPHISQSDVAESIARYEELLQRARQYRNALADLAKASNGLGSALEDCGRGKGLEEMSEALGNAAGVQYLIANHQNVLSDTFYRTYEIPLRDNLETFVNETEERRETYRQELATKKKLLSEREKRHLKLAQRKNRGLTEFREALREMTVLADDMDKLKQDFVFVQGEEHRASWRRVSTRSNIMLKATLQLYGAVASKSDQLEWALVGTPDPWTMEMPGQEGRRSGDDIFAILPPHTIQARPQSPMPQSVVNGPEASLFATLLGSVQDDNIEARVQQHVQDQRRMKHRYTQSNATDGRQVLGREHVGPATVHSLTGSREIRDATEASFFTLHGNQPNLGTPAMKRPASRGSARSRSRQLVHTVPLSAPPETPLGHVEDVADATGETDKSPFQDADEPAPTASAPAGEPSPRRRNQLSGSTRSRLGTPSRPTTKGSAAVPSTIDSQARSEAANDDAAGGELEATPSAKAAQSHAEKLRRKVKSELATVASDERTGHELAKSTTTTTASVESGMTPLAAAGSKHSEYRPPSSATKRPSDRGMVRDVSVEGLQVEGWHIDVV